MKRLRILTLISLVLAILVFVIKNRKPSTIPAGDGLLVSKAWLKSTPDTLTPAKDVRPSDQTFLTFPEWFLVFSPAEQADYFKGHTSTSFPYMKHIDQMWGGYYIIWHQIKGNFPFNMGYHVMIMVIAGSTTVEYGLKSFYETIIGRLTDTGPGVDMTGEDKLNARYEESYVKFIEALPWYEYNFNHQIKLLWNNTPLSGRHLLRKLERRYYLTTELMVKSGYSWLIGLATRSAYKTASLKTTVVLSGVDNNIGQINAVEKIKALPSGDLLASLPRYAEFNGVAAKLAKNNISFKSIAGNNGAILLTVLTTKPLDTTPFVKILFTQPLFTRPGLNRIALVTTVNRLSSSLNMLKGQKVVIEHIYDY